MENLINRLNQDTKIIINGDEYIIKTKTWYSIDEDKKTKYIKCEFGLSTLFCTIFIRTLLITSLIFHYGNKLILCKFITNPIL